MDDNAEDGILRTQLASKEGVRQRQKRSIAYIDERILTYVVALAFIALLVVWAAAESALVGYGALAVAVLTILFWGYLQIRRIDKSRAERARQVEALRAGTRGED